MKAYDVMTKFYNNQWQTEPKLIHTFYDEMDAWRFIADVSTETTFQRMMLRKSLFNYWNGKTKIFGIGAKMYCVVREI